MSQDKEGHEMYISVETLDDLLRRVFEKLLKSSNHIKPSKGPATELAGVLLQIRNPRARLSRTEIKGTLFSCLGELLWYLAKTKNLDFITYYLSSYSESSDDGRTVHGAYGPRLFNMRGHDQVKNVLGLLREKRDSRQAVIQLFDAPDIARFYKDVPCTCTLQFLLRGGQLHMITSMRSNDVFLGLPHDIFAFTMLQEIMARSLSVEVGPYKHVVGSLHLYDKDRGKVERYLEEGWQSTLLTMPPMPAGDPWPSIRHVLDAEIAIRAGQRTDISMPNLDNYWLDFVRLLQIFRLSKSQKSQNAAKISALKKNMTSQVYNAYIEKKQA